VKSIGVENLVLAPGVLEALNNSKLVILATTVVMSQGVTAMGHTGHNSVPPCLLANLDKKFIHFSMYILLAFQKPSTSINDIN